MTTSNNLQIVHSSILPRCPGIPLAPYSRAESIPHIMHSMERFCFLHCMTHCFGCHRWDIEDANKTNYIDSFHKLHIALGYLPKNDQDNLFVEADFGCPACAIVEAMQTFPIIARYSEVKPIGYSAVGYEPRVDEWVDSQPCFQNSLAEDCTGFDALQYIDIDKLPPLPPPELRTAKRVISSAQAIIKYLNIAKMDPIGSIPLQNNYRESERTVNLNIDFKLNAQATGGNAAVTFEREAVKPVAKIESGAVKVEANPTINMPPPLDVVGVVSQFKEGMMEAFREGGKRSAQEFKDNAASDSKKGNRGRPSDTDQEYDTRHAAGWERYRAIKKSKQDYVDDNNDIPDVAELDRILNRVRSRKQH